VTTSLTVVVLWAIPEARSSSGFGRLGVGGGRECGEVDGSVGDVLSYEGVEIVGGEGVGEVEALALVCAEGCEE
jgi:hypothetical protein